MGDEVTLGPDGRLLADEESTGERVRGLVGRYRLLTTSPDLLLLVRHPPEGNVAPTPRVAFSGDLASLGLAEVVEFLHQGRKSGTLRVLLPSGERGVVMHDGFVRGAFSDEPADSLAEICLRLGLIDRAALDAVEAQSPLAGRLGRALVDAGALSSHDLFKAVQFQVGEIVSAMLVARAGAFVFVDEPVEERAIPGVQLSTQALLMDAIRRIDEMAQFRSRLPSGKLFISRRKAAGPALDEEERRAHELCDGTRTIVDLAREMRLGEFDATKIIYHLLQGGYVQTAARPQSTPDGLRRSVPSDMLRVFETIFTESVTAVAARTDAGSFLQSVNGALADEAAARSPFLAGISLGEGGTIDRARLLASLAAAVPELHAQSRALFTALSEVMFFVLFQVGEVLPGQEDEALARRVKELLAQVEPR
jgi:hypothetical protein